MLIKVSLTACLCKQQKRNYKLILSLKVMLRKKFVPTYLGFVWDLFILLKLKKFY